MAAAFGLAACDPPPEPTTDPCVQEEPGKRALVGSYVRQQTATPSLDLVQVGGDVRRNGRLSSLVIEDFTFDARIDRETGGFKAPRGSKAIAVDSFADIADQVTVYALNYQPRGGPAYDGLAVTGPPTPPSQIAGSGSETVSGPILFRITNLAEDADPTPIEVSGTAEIAIKYGSKVANVTIAGLGADAPFQALNWTNLALCGSRLVSQGTGGFQLADAQGAAVNFAGASADSPSGSAAFDGRFFGSSPDGKPTSLGGTVLIQGDNGLISAVFVTIPGG